VFRIAGMSCLCRKVDISASLASHDNDNGSEVLHSLMIITEADEMSRNACHQRPVSDGRFTDNKTTGNERFLHSVNCE